MAGPIRSLPSRAKKRKVHADSTTTQAIRRLEADLTRGLSENTSLNPLVDLLDLALATKNPQQCSKALYALYRVFVLIISNTNLGSGGDEAAKVVKAWLWDRLNIYVDYLGGLLKDEDKSLRTSALQILLSLQKHLSTSYTKATPFQPQFHISHFRKIVSFLLLCPPSSRAQQKHASENTLIDPDVLHQFHETWFGVNDDIRWFFLRESATLLNTIPTTDSSNLAVNLLSILERLNTFPTEKAELNSWCVFEMGAKPPKPKRPLKQGATDMASPSEDEAEDEDENNDEDDWRKFFDEEPVVDGNKPLGPSTRLHKLTIHQSLHSLPSHRAVFTRAWLTLLPRLSVAEKNGHEKALTMRALNVMHRGVMPHLTRPVLVMDWVAGSVDCGGTVGLLALNALFILIKDYNLHLPSILLASFIKRLSRLSLTAPPAAIVMIIPFTYNILKRHPALMVMIHCTNVEDPSSDPYLPEEPNPLNTQAHLSSLWELFSHRAHYHSGVSTLVKIFSEAFTKQGYAMEDFLDHTYGTLFDAEANRKIKKEPPLAIELGKTTLFPIATEVEEDGGVQPQSDVVNELWVFA